MSVYPDLTINSYVTTETPVVVSDPIVVNVVCISGKIKDITVLNPIRWTIDLKQEIGIGYIPVSQWSGVSNKDDYENWGALSVDVTTLGNGTNILVPYNDNTVLYQNQ